MTTFAEGDLCLLVDNKGRHYLVTLSADGNFHYHHGGVSHNDLIGIGDGATVETSAGGKLTAMSPKYSDYVLRMPRGAQVVYPKDAAQILMWADIYPGATVLEAGTGSGALSIALIRAVGEHGRVVSVEQRDDHARHAKKRIDAFFGQTPPQIELRAGDVVDHVVEVAPDRIVLDVPEPWRVVDASVEGLRDGGIFCSYLPTVPQVQQLVETLEMTQRFMDFMTFETLIREWSVSGRSVRPDHRMVGHTGFITVARKRAGREKSEPRS